MPSYIDQLGKQIVLNAVPQRIISLVPSQTELLYHLGLEHEVVGITKFCIHPNHWFTSKDRIGGTKNVNIEKVRSLKPDLVIANMEENVKEQVEGIQSFAPVYVSDVNNLNDALNMISGIGQITNTLPKANQLVLEIEQSFCLLSKQRAKHIAESNSIVTAQQTAATLRTAYLIWKDPVMTVGGDTFINDMMQRAGFYNVFQHLSRYPSVTVNELADANCELILLSTEPYPYKQKHVEELQQLLPNTIILLADGEMFSWYGSRLQYSAAYFGQLWQQIAAGNTNIVQQQP